MKLKRKLALLMVLVMMVFSFSGVLANGDGHTTATGTAVVTSASDATSFSDVPTTHWAYEAIMLMSSYKIITGYNDGTFRPDAAVTKAEFAKMMVLTLQMDLINPSEPTFADVDKGGWDYKYIETAKPYMTAFKTAQGFSFKPSTGAQREDMAVAIVKGLGLEPSTDLAILNTLTDAETISLNLKGYVATAVANGIMIGDANKKFNPKATINRAETASLLARLITEEKIVFDEEKVVLDDNQVATTTQKPYLSADIVNGKLSLDWTEVDSKNFSYYKVVLAKYDETPSYPDGGYAAAISSVSTTGYEVKADVSYNGGDFDGKIKAGETYYVAITAVYGDTKVTSNVVKVKIPVPVVQPTSGSRTPVLSKGSANDGGIKLSWTKTDGNGEFNYYKVVLSKYNSKPSYPNDGYVTYISDIGQTYYFVAGGQGYQGGDVGGELQSGVKYYVTITAVYGSGPQYNTSNTLTVVLP